MNNKYIFFLILAILVIAFLWNKNEHLDATPLSNEAIQNIANVYNKDNLTATNITATGGLNSTGGVNTFGIGGTNQWTLHTPFDGRRIMYIAPKKADNSDWDWGKNTNFENNGNVNFSGSVNTAGGLNASSDSSFGVSNKNQWLLHTPSDGRRIMYLAPKKTDNSDWDWAKNTNFDNNGNVNFSGDINVPKLNTNNINGGIPTTSYYFYMPWGVTIDTVINDNLKSKFSRNDPDGTTIIGVLNFGNRNIHTVHLSKIGNKIYNLYQSGAVGFNGGLSI